VTHPHDERLQDYADDLLCREERAELEQHLALCPVCAEQVRQARELKAALKELPRELDAPADMLAAINARIDEQPLRETRGGRASLFDRPLRSFRPALAAAAIALVALSSTVTLLLVRGRDAAPITLDSRTVEPAPLPVAVLAVERPYEREADALRDALTSGRAVLAPETVRILEQNLAVIEAALAEARAALREDPGNGAVLELLRATHERRIDLLRQARRWTQGT
jgi:hypothetical protein